MPKLHGDGKDEILGIREIERARREELSFYHQSSERIFTCLRYLAVCAWRSPVRLLTLKSSNLH